MTLTLKPCPFCGGRAEIRHVKPYKGDNDNYYYGWVVLCSSCLTSSDNYRNTYEAVKHWNTRSYMD